MIALAGPIRFVVKAWTSGGGQTSSDGLASGGSGASSDGRPAWPGLDGGIGGRAGLDGRAGFLFLFAIIFLPGIRKCTRQTLCRVPDKRHTAKDLFADSYIPCALCRVLHTAKSLP